MNLNNLFNPASIAIVGASNTPQKVGNLVISNLQGAGYEGEIIPVNPNEQGTINGLQVVPSIVGLPTPPDLVIFAIPANILVQEFAAACKAGCKQAVIFTAGFKETGKKGAKLEAKLKELAEEYDVTILGPNCLGFVHTGNKINATFADLDPIPGNAHIVSQSGAIVSAFFDRARATNLGFADCTTLGNKTILAEDELFSFRHATDATGPIGCYLEEITDPEQFLTTGKELSTSQPILILKPGKSAAAATAMQSHTGSMAGKDAIFQAVCNQAGMIRCRTIEDLFDGLLYFSWQPAPAGNRLAIVSNAGGPGVIATDLAEEEGLQLADLSRETEELLRTKLPRAANTHNPVDLLGDAQADRYRTALEAIIDDDADVDMILVVLTPQEMTQIEATAETISDIAEKHDMPVVCTFIGHHHVEIGHNMLHQHQIPCYSFPHRALRVLATAYQRHQWTQRPTDTTRTISPSPSISRRIQECLPHKGGGLKAQDLACVLNTAGIKTPKAELISTRTEGLQRAEQIGYPVVMKLSSPDLLHKYEHDAVITNISCEEQFKDAYTRLNKTRKQLRSSGYSSVKIHIQQQINDGVETIIGYKDDPKFGKVILFGSGGTLTELFHDHQMLVLPASRQDIEQLIEQSSVTPLLDGFRGRAPVNKKSLIDLLEKFVRLVTTVDRIKEFEINPLIVNETAAYAVDPKLILHDT